MEIKALVSQMTLEEKAGLCSGLDFWHTKSVERLGVPSVMVSDGPHGLRKQDDKGDHLGINDSIKAVCMPAASATAASFDRDLIRKMKSSAWFWARLSISSVPLCAEEILSIFLRIPIWRVKCLPLILTVCRAAMWAPPSSTLPPTIRSTAA